MSGKSQRAAVAIVVMLLLGFLLSPILFILLVVVPVEGNWYLKSQQGCGNGTTSAVVPPGRESRDKAVEAYMRWAEKTAADNSYGYSQARRNGPDYDCSSFVYYALRAAGLWHGSLAGNTESEPGMLKAAGFTEFTWAGSKADALSHLQRGDVVIDPGFVRHTEIYAGGGNFVGAHLDIDGRQGDSSGREISESGAVPSGLTVAFRLHPGEDGQVTVGGTVSDAGPWDATGHCSAAQAASATSPAIGKDGKAAQDYARKQLKSFGGENRSDAFVSQQMGCLVPMWARESGWRWNAMNPTSGAYGIPQALPAGKLASSGPDWKTSPATQVRWGLSYVQERYGTPCGAWSFWQAHHWY